MVRPQVTYAAEPRLVIYTSVTASNAAINLCSMVHLLNNIAVWYQRCVLEPASRAVAGRANQIRIVIAIHWCLCAGKYPAAAAVLHSQLQDLRQRGRVLRLRPARLRGQAEHHAVLAAALRAGGEHAGGARLCLSCPRCSIAHHSHREKVICREDGRKVDRLYAAGSRAVLRGHKPGLRCGRRAGRCVSSSSSGAQDSGSLLLNPPRRVLLLRWSAQR